jgi:hypothetical protein
MKWLINWLLENLSFIIAKSLFPLIFCFWDKIFNRKGILPFTQTCKLFIIAQITKSLKNNIDSIYLFYFYSQRTTMSWPLPSILLIIFLMLLSNDFFVIAMDYTLEEASGSETPLHQPLLENQSPHSPQHTNLLAPDSPPAFADPCIKNFDFSLFI